MTRTATAKLAAAQLAGTKHVEDMLRDIAMVLHLTQKVKADMDLDRTTPTGGRFARKPVLDLDPAVLESEFAFA